MDTQIAAWYQKDITRRRRNPLVICNRVTKWIQPVYVRVRIQQSSIHISVETCLRLLQSQKYFKGGGKQSSRIFFKTSNLRRIGNKPCSSLSLHASLKTEKYVIVALKVETFFQVPLISSKLAAYKRDEIDSFQYVCLKKLLVWAG